MQLEHMVWPHLRLKLARLEIHRLSCQWVLAISLVAFYSGCARDTQRPASVPGPLPPNQTMVDGYVVEAKVVDSITLDILPRQPLVVLRVRILSTKPVEGEASFFNGQPEDVVAILSRESSDVNLAKNRIVATISVMGDERGMRLWAHKITVRD